MIAILHTSPWLLTGGCSYVSARRFLLQNGTESGNSFVNPDFFAFSMGLCSDIMKPEEEMRYCKSK